MRFRRLLSCSGFLIALSLCAAPPGVIPQAALKQYAGTWQVTRKSTGDKKEQLQNLCTQTGTFYVCQQSSSGAVSNLLVIAPTSQANRFATQNIQPDGRATGKGELFIEGSKWTFSGSWNGGATITHYRTTDTFTSPTQIHFTQEESTDGSHWQLKDSGDQIRLSH